MRAALWAPILLGAASATSDAAAAAGGANVPVRVVRAEERVAWASSGARLEAGAGSRIVRFEAGHAEGRTGLLWGRLRVRDARHTVVLAHGTVTGDDLDVRATPIRTRPPGVGGSGAVYQGDGGGGGRVPAGAALRAGPAGAFRVASSSVLTSTATEGRAVARAAVGIAERARKRSFKRVALERLQDELHLSKDERRLERLWDLRARQAVARAWSREIIESFRHLEASVGPGVWSRIEALARDRRPSLE